MNLDLVSEMTDKELTIFNVPLIEGAYTVSALLEAGATFEAIKEQLEKMMIEK